MFRDEFEEFRARANSGGFLPTYTETQLSACQRSYDSVDDLEATASSVSRLQKRPATWCENMSSVSIKGTPHIRLSGNDLANESESESATVTREKDPQGIHGSHLFASLTQQGSLSNGQSNSVNDLEWNFGEHRPRVGSLPAANINARGFDYGGRCGRRRCTLTPTLEHMMPISNRSNSCSCANGQFFQLRKVRSFTITRKGLKESDLYMGNYENMSRFCSVHSPAGSTYDIHATVSSSSPSLCNHRVVVTGEDNVGRTTLIQQFVTSESCMGGSFGKDSFYNISLFLNMLVNVSVFFFLAEISLNCFPIKIQEHEVIQITHPLASVVTLSRFTFIVIVIVFLLTLLALSYFLLSQKKLTSPEVEQRT